MAPRIPVALAGHVVDPGTPAAVHAQHGRDADGRLQYLDAYFNDLPGVRFIVSRRSIAFMDAAIYESQNNRADDEEDTWTISVECRPVVALGFGTGASAIPGTTNAFRGIPAPADPSVPVSWQPIFSSDSIKTCLEYVAPLVADHDGQRSRVQPFIQRLVMDASSQYRLEAWHTASIRNPNDPPRVTFEPIRCGKYTLCLRADSHSQCLPRIDSINGEPCLEAYFAWEVFLPDAVTVDDLADVWPPHDGLGQVAVSDFTHLFGEEFDEDSRMTKAAGFVPSATVQRLINALEILGVDNGPTIPECVPAGACDAREKCRTHRGVDPERHFDEEDDAHEAARAARAPNGVDRAFVEAAAARADRLAALQEKYGPGQYLVDETGTQRIRPDGVVERIAYVVWQCEYCGVEYRDNQNEHDNGSEECGASGRGHNFGPFGETIETGRTETGRTTSSGAPRMQMPRATREREHRPLWNLEVDGGVNAETFVELARSGEITPAEAEALLARWNESSTGKEMADILMRMREAHAATAAGQAAAAARPLALPSSYPRPLVGPDGAPIVPSAAMLDDDQIRRAELGDGSGGSGSDVE